MQNSLHSSIIGHLMDYASDFVQIFLDYAEKYGYPIDMQMKKIIKKILEERGITRYRLAKEIGIDYQTLDYMLKKDSQAMKIVTLIKLQEVSGLSVSQFWRLLTEEHSLDD